MSEKEPLPPGTRFSNWTVIEQSSSTKYLCKCDCGSKKVCSVYDLQKGKTKRCRRCSARISSTKHGGSGFKNVSGAYSSYYHMLQRTTNPRSKDYPRYGGRGIKVCELWQESYEAFLLCMGERPGPEYSIERLNSDGDYEPSNCVWATKTEQNSNKSDTLKIELWGEIKTVAAWSRDERCKVPQSVLYRRIAQGMDPLEAVTKPREDKSVAK